MAVLAHFGTFDVENFGDLLFPAILERRLGDLGHEFVHVSPHGGPPVWGDCVATVAADAVIDDPSELAAVIVGGGHIIHTSPATLDRYEQGGLSANLAYPSLWIGAAYLASQRNVPYCWNAPGVPQAFSPAGARLTEWATSLADYLAVRDRASHSRLVDAGVSRIVRVVPDTALEIVHLWSAEELETAFADLFVARGRDIPARIVVIHLNQRYAGEDAAQLAARLDRIAQRLDATPILIAMGPCHGDDLLQREIGQMMTVDAVVIDRPQSLRQIAACIAKADAYLGSSLHGMVTACSFGTKGMVVVPPSAGTYGKFIGFLEQFQLTTWMAESWEDAEQQLDELMSAPGDPWSRVLEAAMPVLDEHWRRMSSVLATPTRSKRSGAARVDKHGGIDRLAALSGATPLATSIFAPIIAEQAMRATQHLNVANEQRRDKEKALAEQKLLRAEISALTKHADALQKTSDALQKKSNDLRDEISALKVASNQSSQLLGELKADRDRLKTELISERERLQAGREEAVRARVEADRTLADLVVERNRLEAEVGASRIERDVERNQKQQAIAERDLLLANLTKERESVIQREKRLAQEDQEEYQRILDAIMESQSREEMQAESLLQVANGLVRLDKLLKTLIESAERQSSKKTQRLVKSAQQELSRITQDLAKQLDAPSQEFDQEQSRTDSQPENKTSPPVDEVSASEWYPGTSSRDRIQSTLEALVAGNLPVPVSIVVPVFNGAKDLKACVDSILKYTQTPYEVILVDDCSTDGEVHALYGRYETMPNVTILRNQANVGFVKSSNAGIEWSTRDVVLLNSDTVVTPRWLQKLQIAAYSQPEIATATPFSNAAGAFSIPELGVNSELPVHVTANDMARIVERLSQGDYPRVPTGNGFCMYIKRAAIQDVGLLDAEHFGRGYGEENHFCLRAMRKGWHNVIDDTGFVYHRGGASFGPEKDGLKAKNRAVLDRLHPEYSMLVREFVSSTHLAEIRERIATCLSTEGTSSYYKKRRILFVLHRGGGGVPQTNEDLMSQLSKEKDFECLILTSTGTVLTLANWKSDGSTELKRWEIGGSWSAKNYDQRKFAEIYWEVLIAYKIDLVHIRHLFKHSFDLPRICRTLGIPVVMSFHDYYFVCPSMHLLDQNSHFCSGHCTPGHSQCQIPSPMLQDLPVLKDFVGEWRNRVASMLENCDAFVTTSESTKSVYIDHFPSVRQKPFRVIEHGRDFKLRGNAASAPDPTGLIRILIAGNIDHHKGEDFVRSLLEIDRAGRLEFHFLGKVSSTLARLGVYHGPYVRDEFNERAKLIAPAFVGIFSIWPETYSHTLTEAWAAGIPILGTSLGAVGERIKLHGGGWLVDCSDPAKTYDLILRIATDVEEYERIVEQARCVPFASVEEMTDQYRFLYHSLLNSRPPNAELPQAKPVVVLAHNTSRGSTYIRIHLPLRHETAASEIFPVYLKPDAPLADVEQAIDRYEATTLLVQRDALISSYAQEVVNFCHQRGVRLVFEIDDDLMSVPRTHPNYVSINERRAGIMALATGAELVLVSTSNLGKRLNRLAKRVEIVRNRLDEDLWFGPLNAPAQPDQKDSGEIRIGYMGAWVHRQDLEIFREPFVAAREELRRRHNVSLTFQLIGGMRDEPESSRRRNSLVDQERWYQRVQVPNGRHAYPQFVPWLRRTANWDIAVAPLTANRLNEAKSELKFLEYAALGISGIYSDVGAYREVVKHRETGLLVSNNDLNSWLSAIMELAIDGDLRDRIAGQARTTVTKNYLLRDNAQLLALHLK